MGVDYCLACNDCHEFIDLHKWPVVEDAAKLLVDAHFKPVPEDSPYPFGDLDTLCKKVIITSNDIRNALSGDYPKREYIMQLKPIVSRMADTHEGHQLFLSCDLGDTSADPWWPDQANFGQWMQIPGVFNYDHYLPRNLVEVFGLARWPNEFDEPLRTIFRDAYFTEVQLTAIKSEFEKNVQDAVLREPSARA